MKEFDLIERYLAPLSGDMAFGLKNDGAIIPDSGLVVTKDAITEGVHFLPNTNPLDLARKLLRVNLSDIAAMGGTPLYYMIAAILPKDTDEEWFIKFTNGLWIEQEAFGLTLLGGDTVRHDGSLTLTLTMFGKTDKPIERKGSSEGEGIFVSGTIGDSCLGFELQKNDFPYLDQKSKDFLISRYNIPQPRVSLGKEISGIATSAIDISDGLIADLGHLCEFSGAVIYKDKIPFSEPAKKILAVDSTFFEQMITWGDDYELLFTANENLDLENVTKIGYVTNGDDVQVLDENGDRLMFDSHGYSHF